MDEQMRNDQQIETMYENLRSLRRARGWTITELSKKSRIRVKILTDIEAGRDFDVLSLIKLCKLYHVKPPALFSGIIDLALEE